MARRYVLAALAALSAGCLAGAHAYLELSPDFNLPAEYVDAATYPVLRSTWLRAAPLGLEGLMAAVLEDPAVGAAQVAYEASRSLAAARPDRRAQETWESLYRRGDRMPVWVRWRFNKHFHRQASVDPSGGWQFRLADDRGQELEPVETGRIAWTRDPEVWLGEFRVWFPRRSIDGRLLITGHTRALTLRVRGNPGEAAVTWRFLPLLDAARAGPLQ